MKTVNMKALKAVESSNPASALYEVVGLTAPIRDAGLSIARCVMAPGIVAQRHLHRVSEEIYIALSGSATINVDDASLRMSPGDVVVIVPGEEHHVITGENDMIEFLAITIPPYIKDDFIPV